MSNLNEDIFYLIFEELKDDRNTLFSCLLVNKSWFNNIIPILWKNPWKYLKNKKMKLMLLKVIISHLSEESRNNIKNRNAIILTNSYQKPLFKYLSFCKYLNFDVIINMASSIVTFDATHIIINGIINLFIHENMLITHLYIPNQFDYKIHLIPGFENCFSELEFVQCSMDDDNNRDIIEWLARVSKSIKNLEFTSLNSNIEIDVMVKLIVSQKGLFNFCHSIHSIYYGGDPSSRKSLEKSLIKHANTLQYLKIDREPCTKIFSYLVNLISLEIRGSINTHWKNLGDASLPHLKFLRTNDIHYGCLAKLIKNTKGNLCEISVGSIINARSNQELIQAIAQSCPNLKYLKIMLENKDIVEFEELLINCKYLDGVTIVANIWEEKFDWNELFEILTESSPIGLFKFKFIFCHSFQLESLNLFFNRWKGRHPMLLQTVPTYNSVELEKYFDLIEMYKTEGIVKKYENDLHGSTYEEFEWIKRRI
ncbi:hypothetical protein RclHR1_06320005 [Rhizophagus clarus]|uniref:F-box domain-containing protein n=1 Tax=Rhizophagus clarus TaxID=94130 RepID=A0A2Z6SI53_9GLOM|nr:hypothetical protein RclHR1_06320005 [Rhizophagus clarus]GES93954.1 hypothetical protein GLOIN_2v1878750 [Rhizophagus clarus]